MNSHYQPDFPATEEMPLVRGRAPRPWFGKLVVLAAIAVAVVFGLLIYLAVDRGSQDDAVVLPDEPLPEATSAPPNEVEIVAGEAQLWRVVGVEGGLNVRAEPGTSGEIIGAFPADERNVRGTGELADVNGSPWTEVDLGGGVTGWVSSRFLAVDDGSVEPTATPVPPVGELTSTVCFQNGDATLLRTIRLNYFDRTNIVGQIRTDTGSQIRFETVTGVLRDGQATVTIADDDAESSRTQTWQFGPAAVQLDPQESVRVVPCATVNALLP